MFHELNRHGIMSIDIIRAEVRMDCHVISRSGHGIMSIDIICAEVRIGEGIMDDTRFFGLVVVGGLFFLAFILYLIFGRNKREKKSVPVGMQLLAMSPMFRYVMYAMGVIMVLFGIFFTFMAIAWDSEIAMGIILLLIHAFTGGMFFLAGYAFYSCHIFFDEEKLIIGKFFRSPDTLKWEEVGRADFKKTRVLLYDIKGKKRAGASSGMVGYEKFRAIAKKKCDYFRKT